MEFLVFPWKPGRYIYDKFCLQRCDCTLFVTNTNEYHIKWKSLWLGQTPISPIHNEIPGVLYFRRRATRPCVSGDSVFFCRKRQKDVPKTFSNYLIRGTTNTPRMCRRQKRRHFDTKQNTSKTRKYHETWTPAIICLHFSTSKCRVNVEHNFLELWCYAYFPELRIAHEMVHKTSACCYVEHRGVEYHLSNNLVYAISCN